MRYASGVTAVIQQWKSDLGQVTITVNDAVHLDISLVRRYLPLRLKITVTARVIVWLKSSARLVILRFHFVWEEVEYNVTETLIASASPRTELGFHNA